MINWVAHRNLLRIDLVGPDFEMGQSCLAVDRRERSIDRVGAVSDLHPSDAGHIIAGIKGKPLLPQVDFKIGVKVHWGARVDVADVRQMAGYISCG